MSTIDLDRPGPWRTLFPHALRLMHHLEQQAPGVPWTFGGGTVLMLRIGHRHSKDIDLFVPDPQCLGYLSPRLNDAAEAITADYEEHAEYLKLFLPGGEIDVVVGQPLTAHPFETIDYQGRTLRVETCAEIIAKKMWHRGDRVKARDLFDLCAVAQAEPSAIDEAAPFMRRHGAAFLAGLQSGGDILRAEFDQIDAIGPHPPFDAWVVLAQRLVRRTLC